MTCAHVVQGLLGAPVEITGLLVAGNAGQYVRAQVAVIDLAHDLAVLTLADVSLEFSEKEAVDGLEIVERYPDVSYPVAYAGFPYFHGGLLGASEGTG